MLLIADPILAAVMVKPPQLRVFAFAGILNIRVRLAEKTPSVQVGPIFLCNWVPHMDTRSALYLLNAAVYTWTSRKSKRVFKMN
jgi:hypothetical protein